MNHPLILFTAAEEDLSPVLDRRTFRILHLPLERYVPVPRKQVEQKLEELERFDQIVHANLRNARFFLDAVRETGHLEEVKKRVNLAQDLQTAAWLEEQGIPAIHPPGATRPIDLMEFLLRLRRTGPTLCPCGAETREELPGLLRELEMPVTELVLFEMEGPPEEDLELYRQQIREREPDTVVFHSRRSVVRTLAAFPGFDLEQATTVSADTGITEKMKENGLTADRQASGSWQSIFDLLIPG